MLSIMNRLRKVYLLRRHKWDTPGFVSAVVGFDGPK